MIFTTTESKPLPPAVNDPSEGSDPYILVGQATVLGSLKISRILDVNEWEATGRQPDEIAVTIHGTPSDVAEARRALAEGNDLYL